MRCLSDFFRHSRGVSTIFLNNHDFLYVSQFVSWLTSLLKLKKFRDISTSGWYIFLKSFRYVPGMFEYKFQITSEFLYVCESFVAWIPCVGVSLFVGLLPYLININVGIYPVLNYVSFCFLEKFPECLYTGSEYFPFPSISVSLLFDSLSFWNYVNLEIYPVLDDISI